jgi:hypothetical protein
MKNKKIKIHKILKHPGSQQIGAALMAFVVVVSIAYIGSHVRRPSSAAVPGTLYAAPVSGNFAPGSTIAVEIHEESGLDAVNNVAAAVTYNTAQLQYAGVTEGTAFPFVLNTSTATPGEVRLARGVNSGDPGVTGDNVIATLKFTVLATSGTANIGFNNGVSLIVRARDSTNIMTSSVGASYTLKFPAPTLGTVAPAGGPIIGSTPITLTGTGFRNGATVTVGGIAATKVAVVSATQITAVTPAHAAGAVTVVVANSDGQQAGKAAVFTYAAPPAIVTAVTPAGGPVAGGTTVSITGSNFAPGAIVRFGTTAATSVTFVSASQLNVVAPPGLSGGAVDIVVANPGSQDVIKAAAYAYTAPAPVVSKLSSASGFATGGSTLTITGLNFANGAGVAFGNTPAASVKFVSGTTLTVVVPSHILGVVSVVVTNPDGLAGRLASAYTYRVSGDSNGDSRVNGIDYSQLAAHDGTSFPAADYNGDGIVGAADLAILLAAWTW